MSGTVENAKPGLPASEFEAIFRKAHVLADGLESAKSANSKSTRMGKFLTPHIGREVTISVNGRTGKAKLCVSQGRAKQKLYYFEVRWDDPDDSAIGTNTVSAGVELHDGLDVLGGTNTVTEAPGTDRTPVAGAAGDQQTGPAGTGNEEQW